jgi:hypothetical protein
MASTPYDGTEDLLKTYYPSGGLTDATSVVMKGIDNIRRRGAGTSTSTIQRWRASHMWYDGTMKLAFMKRIIVFHMILNFIELAMAIVSVDSAIQKIKDNYTNMKDMSQINLEKLQGASVTNAGVTPTKRHKRPKTPEIPKFDVNKPGMQTFLNSMELLSQSYTFTDDKELAWFYLNNLTENSKTTIFSIYPLTNTAFYNSSNA